MTSDTCKFFFTSSSTSNWDFLISEKYTNMNFSDILKIMNTRKIQKSMLVINENEVQEFKVISKIVLYFINDKKNFCKTLMFF